MTILPSGISDIMSLSNNILNEYMTNTKLCNTIIGPLLNKEDLEEGAMYYIYCKISHVDEGMNIPLTTFIKETYNDFYVNGPSYVIKKYGNEITNMYTNDKNIVLDIIATNNQSYNLRIKEYETINEYNNTTIFNTIDSYHDMIRSFICF
jgi:hypothetical protein